MVNFEIELKKLLAKEWEQLPQNELTELMAVNQNLLNSLNKTQTDISLQIEEIYDMAKEDTVGLREALETAKGRLNQLLPTVVGLCDLLEYFCAYAGQSGSEDLAHQGRLLWDNTQALLENCGITRLGETGQPLDPGIHKVQAAAASSVPREHIARVLQSGYQYLGQLLRKAAVIVSTGIEEDTESE
jgi:molecular chaperone GrpE (heat shock protein)